MRTASLAMLLLASFAANGQDIDRGRLL